jgi:two-component system sensor histidine kinase MtrB
MTSAVTARPTNGYRHQGPTTGPAQADEPPTVDAAHELRGATARVSMYASALAQRAASMPADELRAALDRLAEEANCLGDICVGILERNRTARGSGGTHLRVPVAEAIQLVLDNEREPDRRVEVRLDDDLTVVTDPFALNRILSNLLRNAYRHGGPNIVVEAQLTSGALVLSVGDDGPGVPQHLIPLLFERCSTAQDEDDSYGLGLDIVNRLARQLEGQVGYQPNEPRGARFVVTLPTRRS